MEERLKRVAAQREWNFNYKGNLNEIENSGVFLLVFPNGKIYIGSAIQIGLAVGTILKNLVEKKKGWEFKAAQELGIDNDLDWYRLRDFLGIRVSFCECEDFQEF